MPNTAIALDALQPLEIHTDLAAQIAFNHVFAFLDRVNTALGPRAAAEALERLEDAGVGLVIFAGAEEPAGHPDAILELDGEISVLEGAN